MEQSNNMIPQKLFDDMATTQQEVMDEFLAKPPKTKMMRQIEEKKLKDNPVTDDDMAFQFFSGILPQYHTQNQNKSVLYEQNPKTGIPLFHAICRSGRLELLSELMKIEENEYKHEININFEDAIGRTPFLSASAGGKKEIIQFLLKYAKDHEKLLNTAKLDKDKFSALHYAAHSRNIETLQYLLNDLPQEYAQFPKIDINGVDNSLKTALHRAAEQQFSQAVILFAEQPGISLNLQDYNGWTPLHHCSFNQMGKSCQALLKKGARNDIKSKDGKTPLFWGNGELED